MSKPANPPAFPQTCADALDVGMVHEGMTLRDWFAGQALGGLLANPIADPPRSMEAHAEHYASVSYAYADAMLAERERGQ